MALTDREIAYSLVNEITITVKDGRSIGQLRTGPSAQKSAGSPQRLGLRGALKNYQDNKASFGPRPEPPPVTEESGSEAPKDKHTDKNEPPRCVWNGIPYPIAGHHYIASNKDRWDRYSQFDHLDGTIRPWVAQAASFPEGPVFNFTPHLKFKDGRGAGQRYPYPFQAHHLLPKGAFKNLIPDDLKEVLKRVKYDINNGANIIFLPKKADHMLVHRLPCHPTNHPKYSKLVEDFMQKFCNTLQKAKDEAKSQQSEHPAVEALAADLYDIQRKCWTTVGLIGSVVTNRPAQSSKQTTFSREGGSLG